MAAREDWVIIPAKPFDQAKTRLSALLSAPERAQLARTMLGDVLTAASGLAGARRVGVVTASREVAAFASSFGATAIDDRGASGANEAAAAGISAVAAFGAGGILIAPADIPCVLSSDLEAMLAAAQASHVAIARAQRDGGTNALACDKVGRIEPCFGPDSFNRHVAAAVRDGVKPEIVANARLGLDIDEPADLFSLLAASAPSRAASYLRSLDLERRVDRWPGRTASSPSGAADAFRHPDAAVAAAGQEPRVAKAEVRK